MLAGAPADLLDSYEAERLPVAARALGLSSKLLQKHRDGESDAHKRGKETQQLDISYRSGPLGGGTETSSGLASGDRAPDAPCRTASGRPVRLFELFAGPHWTLLRFGPSAPDVRRPGTSSYEIGRQIVDEGGHAARAYGVPVGSTVLVRPDGHIGLVSASTAELEVWLDRVLPAQSRSESVTSMPPTRSAETL